MNLLLKEAIRRAGNNELGFFSSAYYFVYQKQVDVSGDVLAYRVQGIIPEYIKAYLKHIYDL